MLWTIIKKELLLNLLTFKFVVGTVVCVILTAVFVPILAKDYQKRLKEYNVRVSVDETKLKKAKVYMVLTPTVYRSPTVLSIFSEGLEKRIGNNQRIELNRIPGLSGTPNEDNPYLSVLPVLDVSLIVKVVVSLLAFLAGYNVICGEREQGTIRLILSNHTARGQILFGKLIAGLLTLVIPITLIFIIGLLILEFSSMISLCRADWVRTAIIYLVSVVFVCAIYNIGLLFSCLVRKPATALILGLFTWVVISFVIPNGSVYTARWIRPLESQKTKDHQIIALREEYDKKEREISGSLPPAGWTSTMYGPFGDMWFVLLCMPSGVEHWKQRSVLVNDLKTEYARKFWEVEWSYLETLYKQSDFANHLKRTSPVCLYDRLVAGLAGTDLESQKYYMDRVRLYRSSVIEYISAKTDGFSLPSYFTPSTKETWIEFERHIQAKNWEAGKRLREKTFSAAPFLDLQDFPKFVCPPSIAKCFLKALPDLAQMVVINVLLFALSFCAFLKYDIT